MERKLAANRASFAESAKYPMRRNVTLTDAQLSAARAELGVNAPPVGLSGLWPEEVTADPLEYVPSSDSGRALREQAYLAHDASRVRVWSKVRATPEQIAEAAAHPVDIATPEEVANAQAVFLDGATPEQIARARAAFEARRG